MELRRNIFLCLISWAFLETHSDIVGKRTVFGCPIRWVIGADTSRCERESRGTIKHQKGE